MLALHAYDVELVMKKYLILVLFVLNSCFGINNCITPDIPSLEERDFLHKRQVEITDRITQKFKEGAPIDEIRQIAKEEVKNFRDTSKSRNPMAGYFYGYYFSGYIESIKHFLEKADADFEKWEKFYCLTNEQLIAFNREKERFNNSIVTKLYKNKFKKKDYHAFCSSVYTECELKYIGIITSNLDYMARNEYWYYTGRLLSIIEFEMYTDEQREELFFEMYPQLRNVNPHPFSSQRKKVCVIM